MIIALLLIVKAIQITACLTGLLIASLGKNPIPSTMGDVALRNTAWQDLCMLNIRVSSACNLIWPAESDKANHTLAPSWIVCRLIVWPIPTVIFIIDIIRGYLLIIIRNTEIDINIYIGL